MRRGGAGGTIVNILSMSYGGQHFLAAYSSSGRACNLTRNAALRPAATGSASGLNIGWMNTPGEHAIRRPPTTPQPTGWKRRTDLPRAPAPTRRGRAAAFLLSAESSPMSGALVDFDQSIRGAGAAADDRAGG
jgi:NAD(P)-dependent dehydrogenase (short-subunit alcohol dehydrogenase family)